MNTCENNIGYQVRRPLETNCANDPRSSGITGSLIEVEEALSDLYKTVDDLESRLEAVRIASPEDIRGKSDNMLSASPLKRKVTDICSAIRRIEERIQNITREIDL